MKVVHVITDLERGGAEGIMARLVLSTGTQVSHSVLSLRGPGVWAGPLTAAGHTVHCIGMSRTGVNPGDWLRVIRTLRSENPEVIQTWMYHADLVGGIAARISGRGAVAWGIRNLTLPRSTSRRSTRLVRRLSAWLSGIVPQAIVCSSEAAAKYHDRLGYRRDKMVVIPNGVDTNFFCPDPEARARLRAEWGANDSTRIIGVVARWDPQKDHATFLEALSLLAGRGLSVQSILAGPGIERGNRQLMELVEANGVAKRVRLLGPRDDVPAIMNAIDLLVLSSRAESFPNVVAEAMACGTPCVVTNVGDAANIVGELGLVVPPGEPSELAAAISNALVKLDPKLRKIACRHRIETRYGLEAMSEKYIAVWQRLAAGRVS